MTLISLLAGQTFPNYKTLCSYLGEDIKNGNAKDSQLRVWRTLFDWDRIGHSYVISSSCSVEQDLTMRKEDLKISKLKRAYMRASSNIEDDQEDLIELEVGQRFANYIELCGYLKEPLLKGGGKVSQLERWKGFFEWEREGYAYKIVNVITPWRAKDTLWDRSKIASASKLLLSYFLENSLELKALDAEQSSNILKELTIIPRKLYEILGFHGQEWSQLEDDSFWGVPKGRESFHREVRDVVFKVGNEVFRQEFALILDALDRKELINAYRTFYIEDKLTKKVRMATPDEQAILLTAKKEALLQARNKLQVASLTEYEVHQKGVAKEFYGNWLSLAKKYIALERFYPVVKLQAGSYGLDEVKKYLLAIEKKETYRKESNERLQPKVLQRSRSALERVKGRPPCEEDLSWLGELVPVVMSLKAQAAKREEL